MVWDCVLTWISLYCVFDGGMKAINPAYEKKKDRYPIIHPKFSRDFASTLLWDIRSNES